MSKSFSLKTSSYNGRYLILNCSQTQNISNNTSTISWTLTSTGGSSNYYSTGPTTVTINGTQVYYKGRLDWDTRQFPAAKGSISGSLTVQHDELGDAKIEVSLSTAIYVSAVSEYSGTWELESNPRGAQVKTAPNFNDKENPMITYSNPYGNNVTSLRACIANKTGGTIYVAYRDISKTGTSYTFNLTDAEREVLYNASPNSNTMPITFYIETVLNGNTFREFEASEFEIIDANPTINPTVEDTNASAIELTGDSNILIKYVSDVKVTIGATAYKGATIEAQGVSGGGRVLTDDGIINDVTGGSFLFEVRDSRDNRITKTVTKTLIDYIKLTCNLDIQNPTPAGTADLIISGNCFNGSFGAVQNEIVVGYRYKGSNNNTWSEYTYLAPTLKDGAYEVKTSVEGLDYRQQYTFQAIVLDKIDGIQSQERKIKTQPVFDWGENDFNFNVPVTIQGNTINDFIVEQGTTSMGSNGTWYWSKWASGRAECYGCRNYGNMGFSTAYGSLYRSETFRQSLPYIFEQQPEYISIEPMSGSGGTWVLRGLDDDISSSSTGGFALCRPNTTTLEQVYLGFHAIGRWK